MINHYRLKKELDDVKRDNQVKNKTISKNRLKANIKKKFTTSFIGSLASIEKHFGFLWGIDKDDKNKTDSERDYYDLWQEMREEILNKSNKELRSAEAEIEEYEVVWMKHKMVFNFNEEQRDD